MGIPVKAFLPTSWWEVAVCVDHYESNISGTNFPDLRELAMKVSPENRPAAIAELAAVDMEFRSKAGMPKSVETYRQDYPEILTNPRFIEDLIAQEYQLCCDRGEHPTLEEYQHRFPDCNVQQAVGRLGTNSFSADTVIPRTQTARQEPPPELIGRYRVIEELGSGGFGRVFRCRDAELGRDVAVKLPHASKTPTDVRLKEFLHEARSAARLRHSGIVSVLDTGKLDDGRGYVVYECIDGGTLRDRIANKAHTREDAVRWCIEIAAALHYAHTQQIVHRDVSPDNVMLDPQGRVRLTDFGLSKRDDQFFRDDSGRVLGSLAYISPEQARGESHWATPQSDIYSLGVILYELLTGRRPLAVDRSRSLKEILAEITCRTPAPPRTVDDTISEELECICLKAIAKDPSNRFNTAADMGAAMQRAIAPPKRSRSVRTFFFVSLLVSGLFLTVPWMPWGGEKGPTLDGVSMRVVLLRSGYDEYLRQIDLTDGNPAAFLPLRDGDRIHVDAELDDEGFPYLFAGYADGRVELVWPSLEDFTEHAATTRFDYHQEPDMKWLELTPETQYGPEMLLLAVADRRLSKQDALKFTDTTFEPSGSLAGQLNEDIVQVPIPAKAREERGLMPVSLPQEALGEPLARKLSTLFRSYRAVIYSHSESD